MKIALGADHGGLALKNDIAAHLSALGHTVTDYGTTTPESCDYPVYAEKVAEAILSGVQSLGILVCGTGIGMAMAAGKLDGIRAATVGDCFSARMTRMHNDANVLCLGARVTGPGLALDIVDAFLQAEFEGGRHQKRVDMIDALGRRPSGRA